MREEILKKYEAGELYASIPSDRGELFLGYRPAENDIWQEHFRQTLDGEGGRRIYRTVFEHGEHEGGVVVDVTECRSARDAVDELMDTLADNQAAELPPGPESLGPAAFRNPEQAPPALFFARANLRISILAQSNDAADVHNWLGRIQQDLDRTPEEARDGLEIHLREKGDERARLRYELPWKLGPDAWFKFVSEGATLEKDKEAGELVLGPAEAEVSVRGWALERGRESYVGAYRNGRTQ